MNIAAQRRASVILLAIGVVLLSGCTSLTPVSIARSSTPSVDASGSQTPTPSPTPSAAPAPADLSFEAGDILREGDWEMGWGDSLGADPGFTVLSPDDGNGSYSYLDTATQCRLFFYQGAVTDLDMTQDDRTISDDFLATVLSGTVEGATREDVATHAFDDLVFQSPGDGTVATRTIWGTAPDGGSWLHSTRMFGALGAGVYLGIVCPSGQDASAEQKKLVETYLRLIVSPAAAE